MAESLDSLKTLHEHMLAMDLLRLRKMKILFVAPERFINEGTHLSSQERQMPTILSRLHRDYVEGQRWDLAGGN